MLAQASAGNDKPVVSTFLAFDQAMPHDADGTPPMGGVAMYPSPENAVAALARTAAYAEWRRRPEGEVPIIEDIDPDGARRLVEAALRTCPAGASLADDNVSLLLAAYGVPVWPSIVVASADEAVARARQVGYPVALKATEERYRHRPELGTVRLDIGSDDELRTAHHAMRVRLGGSAPSLAIQAMAPSGVAKVVRTTEDPPWAPGCPSDWAAWRPTCSVTESSASR
jgi:acyl-CoA synthetase (NDP forming)